MSQAMGALATSKSTHISMVVPMTAYALCTAFCYYVLFEERRHNLPDSLEKDEYEIDSNTTKPMERADFHQDRSAENKDEGDE